MKILMIAPEPVFRLRGTPFSVRDRCRALSDLGHSVDLITYPFGDDFHIPNVTIHRIRRVPGINDIKIGFSFPKIPLDGLLFTKAILALKRNRYDLIHTHEEAGMMGAILRTWFAIPHLYDMHSSLPQQFENYQTLNVAPVMAVMRTAERYILQRSDGIIAICPHLKEIALKAVARAKVTVIENLAQMPDEPPSQDEIQAIKQEFNLSGKFVVGYTGTFEINQGLDLLVQAFSIFHQQVPQSLLFMAGGNPDQIQIIQKLANQLNIQKHCICPGKIPAPRMPAVMAACDVLASPRKSGTNTPLKLYSYLKSGVPIIATDLLTHTQVLDNQTAVLTDVTPDGIAHGLNRLYNEPDLRRRLGKAARKKEKEYYSYPVYKEKLKILVDQTVQI